MKLYYPNDANKQEYIENITTTFKEKHPNCDEKQIKKMVEIVVATIERVLVPNMAVL